MTNNSGGALWARLMTMAVAGGISPLAFAPLQWWWVALLSYGLLWLVLWRCSSSAQVFTVALVFFLAAHCAGHHWVLHALSVEVGWPDAQAMLIALFVALYMALPVAACLWLWHACHRLLSPWMSRAVWLSSAPLFVMWGEYIRSWAFGGFSSLYVGYAALDTPLSGWLPVGSVWLAGWVMLSTAYVMAVVTVPAPHVSIRLKFCASVMVLMLWWTGWWSTQREWSEPDGPIMSVTVLQTDIAQADKFDRQHFASMWTQLKQLVADADGRLWVAPETAIPVVLPEVPIDVLEAVTHRAQRLSAHAYFGAPVERAGLMHNAVIEFDAQGPTGRMHIKSALMPFGEYMPRGFEWTAPWFDIPLKDLRPPTGISPDVLSVDGLQIAVMVCHEDLDASIGRQVAARAALILNPTNLAWFAPLAGPQRLEISRVRAAEVARPVIRSANGAGSAVIDHRGVVQYAAAPGAVAVNASIQPMQGRTWFVQWGLPWVFLIVAIVQLLLTFSYCWVARTPMRGNLQLDRPE